VTQESLPVHRSDSWMSLSAGMAPSSPSRGAALPRGTCDRGNCCASPVREFGVAPVLGRPEEAGRTMSHTGQELRGGVRKVPDVWTEYPEIVRDLLKEAGFTCGVEPRILEGRDPDWTCIIDGPRIGGDIYIHPADTILGISMGTTVFVLLGALTAVLLVALWQTWVIISLKRRARSS
jgi:hypothetical protein